MAVSGSVRVEEPASATRSLTPGLSRFCVTALSSWSASCSRLVNVLANSEARSSVGLLASSDESNSACERP